jgi:hypothetical protein
MAKVNRSMLKSIVKECLVEILAEGISGGDVEELNESFSIAKPQKTFKETMKQTQKQQKQKVVNEKFEQSAQKIISQATTDPVMAELLADTAKTTLQEQNGADRPNQFTAKPTDSYSRIANESDPMELFGGASSNWASLAFSDNKK